MDLLFFFIPQIIVALIIATSLYRYSKGTLTQAALVKNIFMNIAIGTAILCYTVYTTNAEAKQSSKETIDQILTENEAVSNLRVKHLQAPFFSTMPFSSAGEYSGFFTIQNEKKPLNSDCEIETFDYRWRSIDGQRYVINIEGATLARMIACNG